MLEEKKQNSSVLKRVFICILVGILVFCLSFSKPITARASVFTAVALGTSALGSLVAAYFATAGVTFSGTDATDGNFLGNYVANWVKNSSSFSSNPYFNSSGEFVGSSDDVSVVQNDDTNVVSIIFGKEFAIWLEALKQSFVSDHSLSSNSSSNLDSSTVLNIYDGSVPFTSPSDYIDYNRGFLPLTHPSVIDFFSAGSYTYHLTEGYYLYVSNSASSIVNSRRYIDIVLYNQNSGVVSSSTNWTFDYGLTDYPAIAVFTNRGSSELCFCVGVPSNTTSGYVSFINRFVYRTGINVNSEDISNITLSGELSDGYTDFQDAINQDLTNADEENVAVVDVGSFPDSLTADQIADIILDKIIADELNPTYEGIRENMEEAEEESEGEKPFVPQYPSDWVVINGIQSFFPFCIPWDLAFVFQQLQADPEPPRFTWRLNFGKYADPYDLVIDFQRFDTVARVFRTMMVFVFLVFLIRKTRTLIRG